MYADILLIDATISHRTQVLHAGHESVNT